MESTAQNSVLSIRQSSDTFPRDLIRAGIATMPGRIVGLLAVVRDLLPQVDDIHIFLDGHKDKLPDELYRTEITLHNIGTAGDLGDAGKFCGIREFTGYYFTVDDDILYPVDYVSRMIHRIDYFDKRAILGVHWAKFWRSPVRDYYSKNSRMVHKFHKKLARDRRVHVLGTGTVALHTDTLPLSLENFPEKNRADLFLALRAWQRRIPLIAIAREAQWLQDNKQIDYSDSIFRNCASLSRRNTQLANTVKWITTRWPRNFPPAMDFQQPVPYEVPLLFV